MDNLTSIVVREVNITELNLLLQALELLRIRGILNFILRVENLEETLTRRNTLVDARKLVDEGTNRSCNLREGCNKCDKARCAQGVTHNECTTENQDNSHSCDTQELAHWRSRLLTTSHPKQGICEGFIQFVELLLDILGCCVCLYDFDTAERLVEHADHIAHTLLAQACRVAQLLDDAADNEANHRQEQHRKESQLPRDIQHQHNVTDNEERLTEQHLQSVGNTKLHNTHIGCDTRHNIALALTAKVAYILADNAIEHSITHTQNGLHTHLLDRITAQIAEEVREEIHHNQDYRQQHKYIGDIPSIAEDIRISVV